MSSGPEEEHRVEGRRYSWTLCLQHPEVGSEVVDGALGWAALLERVEWAAAPAVFRDEIDGGRDGLRWAGRAERERFCGFFEHLCELVSHLERNKVFLAEYLGSGGRGVFVLRLFGGRNVGGTLVARDVMRLGRLGVALRVEVAPVW